MDGRGWKLKGLFMVLLLCFPSQAFSAHNVTHAFDMDRDGDVDGQDLGVIAGTTGFMHLGTFSAHFGRTLDESRAPLTPKVMIINFDPILEDEGGVRLTQYLGWNAVDPLVKQYIMDIKESSGGYVNYIVVENNEVDAFPIKQDGFQYTDESYLDCWSSGGADCHNPDGANYHTALSGFSACEKLNNGDIDEVWLFGGPWFGYYESRLAGPGAFWYNAPPLQGTSCDRLLPIMGFNYERAVAEMLHSFGHRAESSMTEVFGSWAVNVEAAHDWDLFGHNLGQSTFGVDVYQCGTIHYPPNGRTDYDYGSTEPVESACDDWYGYPNLTGTTETIHCEAWGCSQHGYMAWWLDHLPRSEGYYGGKLLNWWGYIVGNRYDEIYPRVIGFSSEYGTGWANQVLDGQYGVCNAFEWATAGQPSGWVEILVKDDVRMISLYDRACGEQVTSGHIEFDNGELFYFGALDNDGIVPTVLDINKEQVEWIRVHIDTSTGGDNPGIGEVVFTYF